MSFGTDLGLTARGRWMRGDARSSLIPHLLRSPFEHAVAWEEDSVPRRVLGDRGGGLGRLRVQPLGVFLLEVVDEPAPRRPRGSVGAVDGRHGYDVAVGRGLLGRDRNALTPCPVSISHSK